MGNNCDLWLIILAIISVILPYFIFFHDGFSRNSDDWGALGSYFGGMVSIISIVLLYYTLREQRKEYYRMNIEAGYNRILSSISSKYTENKEAYDKIVEQISNVIEAETKDSNTKNISWGTIAAKVYDNENDEAHILDIFNTYAYLARGIRDEQSLKDDRKKHYLQNLIYSIPLNINIIVIFHLLAQFDISIESHDKDIINLLQEHKLYNDTFIGNSVMNQAKDDMLGYNGTSKGHSANYVFMIFKRTNNQNKVNNGNK